MRKPFSILIVGIILAFAFTPLSAKKFSDQEIRAVSNKYANCVVSRQHTLASEALINNVDNETLSKKYRKLIIGNCLVAANGGNGARMGFGGDLYRYALAEALIKVDFPAPSFDSFDKVPPLEHLPLLPEQDFSRVSDRKAKEHSERLSERKTTRALSKYGECVVRFAPQDSLALMETQADSTEETTGFQTLQPALSNCLAEGTKLGFGKSVLRGSIAINYFRLAHAAKAGSSSQIIEAIN